MTRLLHDTFFRGRWAMRHLLLEAGVSEGDEVGVPSFTCSAVAEAVLSVGARPVWIDVAPSDVTMCPNALRDAIATHELKVVVVQSTFGVPPDSDVWDQFPLGGGRVAIEDMCHAVLGHRNATPGVAHGGCFYSFEWGKPIIGGLGGVVAHVGSAGAHVEPPLSIELRVAAQSVVHSLAYRPSTYWWLKRGFGRAVEAGAAVGNYAEDLFDIDPVELQWKMPRIARLRARARLMRAESLKRRATENGRLYSQIVGPAVGHDRSGDLPLSRYPLLIGERDRLIGRAQENRVEIASWYSTPVHPLEGDALAAVDYSHGHSPNAEAVCGQIVSLPLWSPMSSSYLRRVERVFSKCL